MESLFSFLRSKKFLVQVLIAVGILIVVFTITLTSLSSYTNHGESYTVPNLRGIDMEEAKQLLRENKMELILSDSLFVDDAKPGSVLEQLPQAGHQVKEGRKVFVTICAYSPEQILMPQLTDISYRQAVSIIQSYGLRVGKISYKASEYEDLVLDQICSGQHIPAGTPISTGTYIGLVVGKRGSLTKIMVPDLLGATKNDAQQTLSNLSLNLGAVIYDSSVVTASDSLNARVIRQKPAYDSLEMNPVDGGSLVDIWLSINNDELEAEGETTEIEF